VRDQIGHSEHTLHQRPTRVLVSIFTVAQSYTEICARRVVELVVPTAAQPTKRVEYTASVRRGTFAQRDK